MERIPEVIKPMIRKKFPVIVQSDIVGIDNTLIKKGYRERAGCTCIDGKCKYDCDGKCGCKYCHDNS